MEQIVNKIADLDKNVADIANKANERATSFREINVAVSQMDHSTKRNAEMVERTTAATNTLQRKSLELCVWSAVSISHVKLKRTAAWVSSRLNNSERIPVPKIFGEHDNVIKRA